MQLAGNSYYLFPSDHNADRAPDHVQDRVAVDASASEGAVLTRLQSALDLRDTVERCGAADDRVTRFLRQPMRRCSRSTRMKLPMKRKALQKLNHMANESAGVLGQDG
jgi:hypothetical protein